MTRANWGFAGAGRGFLLLAAVAFAVPVAAGDSPPGEWRIVDGDTIARGGERVRLCAVDTPERGEPGAAAATGAMRGLLRGAGGAVRVVPAGVDRFGRIVGRVFIGEVTRRFSCWRQGWRAFIRRFADACEPAGLSAADVAGRTPPIRVPEGNDGKARKTPLYGLGNVRGGNPPPLSLAPRLPPKNPPHLTD